MNYLIEFDKMSWNESAKGLRTKTFMNGNQQIRLVEFSEGFIEPDWCIKGHAGYVLDGTLIIDFNGNIERYHKGAIIFIPPGKEAKHKVIIEKNGKTILLAFEIIEF